MEEVAVSNANHSKSRYSGRVCQSGRRSPDPRTLPAAGGVVAEKGTRGTLPL